MALTALIRGGDERLGSGKAPLVADKPSNGKAEFDWPCDGFVKRCLAKARHGGAKQRL